MKKITVFLVLLVFILSAEIARAQTGSVTLSWDPPKNTGEIYYLLFQNREVPKKLHLLWRNTEEECEFSQGWRIWQNQLSKKIPAVSPPFVRNNRSGGLECYTVTYKVYMTTNLGDFKSIKVFENSASQPSQVSEVIMPTFTVSGLAPGTYYFAVTTHRCWGAESNFSKIVSKTIPPAE